MAQPTWVYKTTTIYTMHCALQTSAKIDVYDYLRYKLMYDLKIHIASTNFTFVVWLGADNHDLQM